MTTAAILFIATFLVVLALGFQSLNVNGGHKALAVLTSFAIGTSNLVLFKTLPGPTDYLQIAAYLLGGPAGILTAMALHPKLVKWLKREAQPSKPAPRFHAASPQRTSKQPDAACIALAQSLLDPEDLGWAATPEIRERAARALNP